MNEDRLVNVLATFIQYTIDDQQGDDEFEEGGNYYLWNLARELEIQDAVTDELYHRDGGPE